MALFHQVKHTDENERIAKAHEETSRRASASKGSIAALQSASTRGRKPDPNSKKLLTLRLDPDVIDHFKATGDGWQSRMNEALRKAAGLT
ncbi:BrnA antitoxin family protein [Sinorhizobium medicae]|uniref:BrnA antitoxin family protein n=1 Tax=Sinorhizobium medicae TaxID=110321 RepID=A0A508X1E7_9HYPH|nr:BrnA antitoxin family protein [Sinorhizobium medicae]VTZ61784.1 conserved hypothetical protein [Sinorhizobium medicae]